MRIWSWRLVIALVAVIALMQRLAFCAEKASPTGGNNTTPMGRFVSPGQFVVDQLLGPSTQRFNQFLSARLALPAQARVSNSSRPLKQITLLSGDRLTAEVISWRDDYVELLLSGGQVILMPRTAIVQVRTLDGEQEVFYESFDRQSTTVSTLPHTKRPTIDPAWIESSDSVASAASLNVAKAAQPLNYDFSQPLSAGRVQLWFKAPPLAQSANGDSQEQVPSELMIDFDLASAVASQLTVRITSTDALLTSRGIPDSLTTQRVTFSEGWHCLTAALFPDHAILSVDSALLMSTSHSLGPLGAVRFSGKGAVWIDNFQVSQFEAAAQKTSFNPSTQDDCLALLDGEQRFGRVSGVTSAEVVLADSTGDRAVPWSQVVGFALCQSDKPPSRPISPAGLWATIELQPFLDRIQHVADHLTATIVYSNGDVVVVAHPWLGRLAIPWDQIAAIKPHFFGQSLTLDARRMHLGDAIRDDFIRQIPDGTVWSAKFQLPPQTKVAASEGWLSLDVIDLEPAGPQTPPASPFLRELQSGQLLTKISVNNQPAGDLNRWIHDRATPDRPERIRCLLPAGLLRSGENLIRLHQIPLQTSGSQFDNCELSNMHLELVEPLR